MDCVLVSGDREGKTGKWALFILPFITVLREGLEAVIFVGGVALGQPATSIPIAAIVGLICGLACGFLIYTFASRTSEYCPPDSIIFPNVSYCVLQLSPSS